MDKLPIYYEESFKIPLFKPFIPPSITNSLENVFTTRWIGQGPQVDIFERIFSSNVCGNKPCIAVNAGTHALHLSYLLSGLKQGDEVIVPVFTCAATNIPLLWERAKIVFVDIEKDSMNIDVGKIEDCISDRTKAIVCVHYGGYPCELSSLQRIEKVYNIPVIQDSAQAIGALYEGKPISSWTKYTAYSFQAIKHITTGDGGMLCINQNDSCFVDKARRLRWFGIDRASKLKGKWSGNIEEIGYKYQMNDIAACMGICALQYLDSLISKRIELLQEYENRLSSISGIEYFSGSTTPKNEKYKHAAWLCTVLVKERECLIRKLNSMGIEAHQVHYRNDKLSIFQKKRTKESFPNMDSIEDKYLLLPLHQNLTIECVDKICNVIESGW